MPIAKKIVERLQSVSQHEPLLAGFLKNKLQYHDGLTLLTILNEYATYYGELTNPVDKQRLSQLFWEIIESLKTPFIEVCNDGSTQVYFLYRKQNGNDKNLYIQGDYHGYGSTLSSQQLNRFGDTDVMCCITPMKKELENALITYHFVEVPPEHHNQKADYFYTQHIEFKNLVDKDWLPDPFSKHHKAFEGKENEFCVNAENDITYWRGSDSHIWPSFVEIQKDTRLTHLVQKPNGQIVNGWFESFADDIRSIQVFKPTQDVKNIVIVNDGFAYLLCNGLNRLQGIAEQQKCIFIFISPLGGIGDSNAHLLGLRGIEYHLNIDQYTAFVLNQLLPELNKQGVLPNPNPTNMTVIGASLSGTAALKMGLTHPNKFRQVIAHSPSPHSKEIIDKIPNVHLISNQMFIDIECGQFENLNNAQNDNLAYARTFEELLKIEVHVGLHGHQTEAWVVDLDRSLAATFEASHKLDAIQKFRKSTELPSTSSQSIFSRTQEASTNNTVENHTRQLVDRKKGG